MKTRARICVSGTGLGAAVLAALLLLPAVGFKDPFQGKWKINAAPDGQGKSFSDVATFTPAGQMQLAEFGKQGWGPADYDADARFGGIAAFKANFTHASQGTMAWTGQIAASEIRGSVVWTKPNGDETRYTYTGTKN